jgi:hypothetical protein
MSEEKKKPNRITAHYATDEDYKRMGHYTIGTFHRVGSPVLRAEQESRAGAETTASQTPMPKSSNASS